MERKALAEILDATPDVGKVRHLEFGSYITVIERKQKVGNTWRNIETPYMNVDGRLAMAAEDHRRQEKRLDILPATVLVNDDRELTLQVTVRSEVYGERSGVATSRRVDGPAIEQQHPWEIAETSAIGRALACFGYGLLPGSGLASAEDMERALESGSSSSSPQPEGSPPLPSGPSSIEDILKEVRQLVVTKEGRGWGNEKPTPAQRQLLASKMNEALESDDETARHTVYNALVGVRESANMTKAEVAGLLDWLIKPTPTDKYALRQGAADDVTLILETASRPLDVPAMKETEPLPF